MATTNTQLGPGELRPDGGLEHGLLEGGTPGGRLVPALLIAAISASGLSMLFSVGAVVLSANDAQAGQAQQSTTAPAPEDADVVSVGIDRHTGDRGLCLVSSTRSRPAGLSHARDAIVFPVHAG